MMKKLLQLMRYAVAAELTEAEYKTDCMHCKHRDAADSRACLECDIQCEKCTSP